MQTITIDWIAFTIKEPDNEPESVLLTLASAAKTYPTTPTNGYTIAVRTDNEVVGMWNPIRTEMGLHVIIAGSALRNICQQGDITQLQILERCSDAGGRFTRLDLAKDVRDVSINLDSVYRHIEARESSGTARRFAQVHSPEGGNTVYVGSRESERFLRIYNKAAQMGLKGTQWHRMEIEAKGMVARALATVLLKTDKWAGVFDDFARTMLAIPKSEDYQKFFGNEECPIGFPKIEKRSDREAWIVKQVLPAVLEHYAEFPDSLAVKMLRDMIDLIDRQNKQE